MPASVQKTISASILMFYYDKFADGYNSDYPEVRNPSALLDGVSSVVKAIGDGMVPANTLLYVLEDEQDERDPMNARYVITLRHNVQTDESSENFAIRLFYTGTNELESVSSIEEDVVVWSPDNLENSQHKTRTKYYLGFVYMLCDKSPGFDVEADAEAELTLEDLIALGVAGELPAELVEITLDTESGETSVENVEPVQAIIEETPEDVVVSEFDAMAEELFGENADAEAVAVPEQDDTEVLIYEPSQIDEEFDDLATDYEELFDESMFN